MRRYWNVNVTSGSINPAQPVSVRFFFDTNEAAWAINRRNTVRTASYPSTFATAWRWFKNTTGAYVPTANVDGNIFLFPNVTLTPAGSLSVLGIAPYTGTINSVAHVDLGGITSFSGGTGGLGFTPINGGILPVELINFEGKEAERANQLVWSTASEKNNDYYVVESSLDGMSFSPIGTVKGAGTSNQLLKYSLNDYNYYMPGTYYRLKQVDFDGEFTYSNVIFISRKSTVQFKANVYPNPTDGRLTLNTTTPVGGIAKVNIYNSLGQTVFASDISFSEGVTTTEFNLVELPSGLYMIEVNGLEEKAVFKFTKR